jgi:putative membrane protein
VTERPELLEPYRGAAGPEILPWGDDARSAQRNHRRDGQSSERTTIMELLAHAGGWGGPGPWIGIVWLLLIGALVALWAWRWRGNRGGGSRMATAEAVLAERFARGDIDEDQLRRAREALREGER